MKTIKSWLAFLGQNNVERALVIASLLLFGVICFFIPAFSALPVFNLVNIVLTIALCGLIFAWRFFYRGIVFDWFFVALVVFNIAVLISNSLNADAVFTKTYLTLSLFAFALYQMFVDKSLREAVRTLMGFGLLLFAFYFVLYYRSLLFDLSVDRIGDHFDNFNTVGYYFLYAFVISMSFVRRKNLFSLLYLIPAFLHLFLLYRTGSRSALLLAALCCFIFVFYFFRGLKLYVPIFVNLGFIGLALLGSVIAEKVFSIEIFSRLQEFLDSLIGTSVDYSASNRVDLFFESFNLFLRKPLFGWGTNVFSIYSSERLFAHNNVTGLLCEFGLAGFLPFEAIAVYSYYRLSKKSSDSSIRDCCLLLLVAFIGIQFFYVNSQLKLDWVVLAFAASDFYGIQEKEESEPSCWVKTKRLVIE